MSDKYRPTNKLSINKYIDSKDIFKNVEQKKLFITFCLNPILYYHVLNVFYKFKITLNSL